MSFATKIIKISNLVIKDDFSVIKSADIEQANEIYKFTCFFHTFKSHYVGLTHLSLRRTITMVSKS